MLVAHMLCSRQVVLASRSILRRTFFSPPAPQPSMSAPSSSSERPPAYNREYKTVQMHVQDVKANEETRTEAEPPSHVGNPDYGGKYGQQEAERHELVKE